MNIETVISKLKTKIAEKEALLARYDEEGFAAGYMSLDSSITELKAILSDLEKCGQHLTIENAMRDSHPAKAMLSSHLEFAKPGSME